MKEGLIHSQLSVKGGRYEIGKVVEELVKWDAKEKMVSLELVSPKMCDAVQN